MSRDICVPSGMAATSFEGVLGPVAIVKLVSEVSELCAFPQKQHSKTRAATVPASRVCTGAFASCQDCLEGCARGLSWDAAASRARPRSLSLL